MKLPKHLTPQHMRIIQAGGEIRTQPEPDPADIAFMARQLIQATLPHSDPGKVEIWERRNGNLTLRIRPGWDHDRNRALGYPYGTIPRLLLFWITTEALRTKSRRLYLGNSLAAFMRELGLDPTRGGRCSDATRLRDQMMRLFRAIISFDRIEDERHHWLDMQIAPEGCTSLWWDFHYPTQNDLFSSWIDLNERFYAAIIAAPVPVDMRALRALKRSPLALDLYAFVSYKAFVATQTGKVQFITWEQLMGQLGQDYSDVRDFRRKTKAALHKIKAVYPGLILGDRKGGIEIQPGASAAVPPKRARRKKAEA
ncbi:MAG: hypothetical protein JOY71_23180 [Acetobacteraceae bacterium]|nr:hypothetical protein [Acetobacteraceae bacterium]